jgi:hypothetical protein
MTEPNDEAFNVDGLTVDQVKEKARALAGGGDDDRLDDVPDEHVRIVMRLFAIHMQLAKRLATERTEDVLNDALPAEVLRAWSQRQLQEMLEALVDHGEIAGVDRVPKTYRTIMQTAYLTGMQIGVTYGRRYPAEPIPEEKPDGT